MLTLEKEVERALVRLVRQHGGLCLKWVCPGWSGVPDRIIILSGGHIIFAEVKQSKGGRYSPMQCYWADRLRKMGFRWVGIRSESDIRMIEQYIKEVAAHGEL